jgi:hypothetical protein
LQYPDLYEVPSQSDINRTWFENELPPNLRCILFDEFHGTCTAQLINKFADWRPPAGIEFKGGHHNRRVFAKLE